MSKRPTKEESIIALLKPLTPMSVEVERELKCNSKMKKAVTIKKTLKGASLPLNVGMESVIDVS
jgi:hypothetical protein